MGFLGDVFGSKQKVTSPGAGQQAALTENIKSMGRIGELGNLYNTYQNQAAMSPFLANDPSFQSNWNQAWANTGQLLQGQVPSDVKNLETQLMAERGISVGQKMTDSPNANAAWLRAMGNTSWGAQQQGLQNQFGLMQATPQQPLFNPNEFLIKPMEQYQAQQNAYGIEAQPDPFLASMNKMIMSGGGMLAGGFLGGALGGGMGGGLASTYSGNQSLIPQSYQPGGGGLMSPDINIDVSPTINSGGGGGIGGWDYDMGNMGGWYA